MGAFTSSASLRSGLECGYWVMAMSTIEYYQYSDDDSVGTERTPQGVRGDSFALRDRPGMGDALMQRSAIGEYKELSHQSTAQESQ